MEISDDVRSHKSVPMDYQTLSECYNESLRRIEELEHEVECMAGILTVMKEDLQIKDEQFDFLYSSIRARNDQNQSKDHALRQRLSLLESMINDRVAENNHLQTQLRSANHRLSQLSKTSTECWLFRMPNEVLDRIISYTPSQSLGNFVMTSSRMYKVGTTDMHWSQRLQQDWGTQKYKHSQHLVASSSYYKINSLYHGIDSNWLHQRGTMHNCTGHNGTVTCLSLMEDKLITGSDDGSLLLWQAPQSVLPRTTPSRPLLPPPTLPLAQLGSCNFGGHSPVYSRGAGAELGSHRSGMQTCVRDGCRGLRIGGQHHPTKLRSYHGHGGPIWCLDHCPASRDIFSGSYDSTIKVWDMDSGKCKRTLRGHVGWVSGVSVLDSARIASTSWDSTLRIWGTNGTLLRTCTVGNSNALYCLSVCGGQIAVGARNSALIVFNAESGQARVMCLGHGKEVYSTHFGPGFLISGSGDNTLKVWDENTGHCVQTWTGHSASVMTCQHDGDYRIISGSYDKTIKVWDTRKYSHALQTPLVTYNLPHAVFCLKFDDTRLMVGGTGHCVTYFDFSL